MFYTSPNPVERTENPGIRYCEDCYHAAPRRRPSASKAAAVRAFLLHDRDRVGDPEEIRRHWFAHRRGGQREGRPGKGVEPAWTAPVFHAVLHQAVVSIFVDECCMVDDGGKAVGKADLFAAWCAWAESEGYLPGSAVAFGRALHAGCPTLAPTRLGKARLCGWRGIALTSATTAPDPDPPATTGAAECPQVSPGRER